MTKRPNNETKICFNSWTNKNAHSGGNNPSNKVTKNKKETKNVLQRTIQTKRAGTPQRRSNNRATEISWLCVCRPRNTSKSPVLPHCFAATSTCTSTSALSTKQMGGNLSRRQTLCWTWFTEVLNWAVKIRNPVQLPHMEGLLSCVLSIYKIMFLSAVCRKVMTVTFLKADQSMSKRFWK